ncbi:MAG: radical SAM protein [Candidatus Wolfebacteria bacterium]|nr:radical SAM protein [Candidatus Wolfebacteria bacterium]
MDVVLFYPRPWPGETMSGRVPFSLVHLYSYLKGSGFNVKVVDERIVSDLPSLIKNLGNQILCFGISSFTGIQIQNGLNISSLLREAFPYVPIVWGGWHPSLMADQTLKHPLVDIVVRGQGEETFRELLVALKDGKDLAGIKGISYKNGAHLFHNPDRELLPFLQNMEMDYGCIEVEKYVYSPPWSKKHKRALSIVTGLGCAYDCGFCSVASIYKRQCFNKNIDSVLNELDYFVEKGAIDSFTIEDDNFLLIPNRVQILNNFDNALLNLVKDAGCQELRIGVESGSDEVLKLINKKTTVSNTLMAIKKLSKIDISLHLSSMVCFPGIDSNEIEDTMNLLIRSRELNPRVDFRMFYYTPYPLTKLYETSLKNGMKEPKSLEEWADHTLRRFRGPWVKKFHRKLVRYFCFYYYPYSGALKREDSEGRTLIVKILTFLFRVIFENRALFMAARWRVKHRFYRFPVDAAFVMFGLRLKSWYGRIFYGNLDKFSQYAD